MRVFYLIIICIGIGVQCFAQSPFTVESEGYYTIVGAFAIKKNATRFNASLRKKGMNSSCNYLPSQNIYYVYTLRDADVAVCLKEMQELRKKPEFGDAWVRYIKGDDSGEDNVNTRIEEEVKPTLAESPVMQTPDTTSADTTSFSGPPLEEKPIIPSDQVTLGNTEIFLKLYNATNQKPAEGMVQVVDTERSREITEVKGNTNLMLPDPKSNSGNLSLICDVFGYRKVQKEINYNKPLADSSFVAREGAQLIANFELVRYQRGDIRTLYNVYFYNDAAVMMPESKFELNAILDMMNENPNYRIRLHGHSNGNYHGKIIKVGPSGDFFSVREDAITSQGSAKELSESRAKVIKDYLVANGIDASRIEIKSWGGKRPLYDKNGANAKKNIRVEVEILQH